MKEPGLEQRLLVMKMIWGAFILTLFVFGGVLQVAQLMTPDPGQSAPYLVYGGIVFGIIAFGAFFPKKLYESNKQTMKDQGFLDQVYVPWVLKMVLMEQVALVGFVFCFQSGEANAYLPFLLVAFVAQAISFPSENRLRSMFE